MSARTSPRPSHPSGSARERVAWAQRRLASTGRGKHLPQSSYYHLALVATCPDVCRWLSQAIRVFRTEPFPFNVVKLANPPRLSLLRYEAFDNTFPTLLTALSCHIDHGTTRETDYAHRDNPPILHRKELLLPSDHPEVPGATDLTQQLEALGAFVETSMIGTRHGWAARLASLGIQIVDGQVIPLCR